MPKTLTSKTKRTSKSKQKTSKAKKVSKPVSDDDAIIERVQRERPDLWKGDLSKYGDDHSRADLALCGTIARHCGFDPERIDRIFRKSPLYRDKWERDDYRETTIAKAVDELDGKPIEITGGQLPRMVDEAEDALIADIEYGGDYVFQRGSQLVRLVRSKVPKVRDGIRCPAGYLSALAVLKSYLIERLTRVAVWIKYDARSNEFFPEDCPEKVADVYLGRVGCWELPVLHAIVQAPTLRRDGSILQTPSYDDATGIYFDPGDTKFEDVSENPTEGETTKALEELIEILEKFPYVAPSDRAAAIAAILTVVSRTAYPNAPMFTFSAPTAGTGKSLHADIAAMLATGRKAPAMSQGKDTEEQKKRVLALLLECSSIVLIDNIDRPFGGDMLCSVLTQEVYKDRILGRSQTSGEVPTTGTTWFGTGNNLTILGDLKRRVVPCSLDAKEERPEERKFERNLYVYVPANRGRLVRAALTILRAYVVAGRPDQKLSSFGNFEEWSGLVRSALVWLGEADPLGGGSASRRRIQRSRASDSSFPRGSTTSIGTRLPLPTPWRSPTPRRRRV